MTSSEPTTPINRNEIPEHLLDELNRLVGLSSVKDQLIRTAQCLSIYNSSPGHYMFVGNPGTGKSRVASIFGKLLQAGGILKSGHVVECQANDLIAPYVGQTTLKTREVCESALDGILFIDEAYHLVPECLPYDSPSIFAQEAFTTLLEFAEEHRDRFCIIFAGYPEPMKRFSDAVPFLAAKIQKVVLFPDYSAEELTEIFRLHAENNGFFMAPGAMAKVKKTFNDLLASSRKVHSNARLVPWLFLKSRENIAQRMVDLINSGARESVDVQKYIITPDDIPSEIGD